MDGLNSFYETDTGLYHLVSNESTAMIVDTPIHSFTDYHCKVIKHISAVVFRFKQVPFSFKNKNENEKKTLLCALTPLYHCHKPVLLHKWPLLQVCYKP